MSKVLTIEVPDELYAAMEKVAREESRSPEEVGLAQWRKTFGAYSNGKTNGTLANKPKRKLDLPEDDPLKKWIGAIDCSHCPDVGTNHDYYLAQEYLNTHDDEDEDKNR
jgi:hypothetical protein